MRDAKTEIVEFVSRAQRGLGHPIQSFGKLVQVLQAANTI